MQQANQEYEDFLMSLPPIEIPPPRRPNKAEIERRRALYKKVAERRKRLPRLGMASDELVHLARSGDDDDEE